MSDGGGFRWGLTPGEPVPEEPPFSAPAPDAANPSQPAYLPPLDLSSGPSLFEPAAEPFRPGPPAAPAPPVAPVPPAARPQTPAPPTAPVPPSAPPPADPFEQLFSPAPPTAPAATAAFPPAAPPAPTQAFPPPPAQVPPIAPTTPPAPTNSPAPTPPTEVFPPTALPTQAFSASDAFPPTQAFTPEPFAPRDQLVPTAFPPSREVVASDPDQWRATAGDFGGLGATEVIEAEIVSPDAGETSALDALFGEAQFADFSDEPMIAPLPPRESGGPRPPRERTPIPKTQKVLMWVAGGLVAALALVALYMVGTRMSGLLAQGPVATPTPTAPASVVGLVGPVAPGEHPWYELLGGECLATYESAWQDSYTVVDCTQPHPAQMVYRGVFDDAPDAVYPGVDELQARINLLCTAKTVIDYSAAKKIKDVQVAASFAANQREWDDGNHSYFCYVSRSSGTEFTTSIAMPQVPHTAPPTPTPTPAPTVTP